MNDLLSYTLDDGIATLAMDDGKVNAMSIAMLEVAAATAKGLSLVAQSLVSEGGDAAMKLRIAEAYVAEFGKLAKEGNTLVVPSNLSDISSMVALATSIAKKDPPGTV